MAGAMMAWSSVPSEPSSPAWGLSPATAMRGAARPKRCFRDAHRDPHGGDDQLAGQLRDGLAQGKMDRHRNDGDGGRPQHHDRLRQAAVGRGEFGEKFGMAGMTEAGAVEHALGDRIGDNSAGAAGHDVGDRLTDGSGGGGGAGGIGLSGRRGGGLAAAHDRQRVARTRRWRPRRGPRQARLSRPRAVARCAKQVAIADQIEGGQLQFIAAQPRHDRDVGPDARGFT